MPEVTVTISDEIYATATRRAQKGKFRNTEAYLACLIARRITGDAGNYDHLFTPDVIASIEAAAQQAREGKCLTMAELNAHLVQKRSEYLRRKKVI